MSDTPETDGVADFFVSGAFSTNPDNKTVPLEFSRKLERERDEAREKYCEVLTDNMLHIATITRLERERDNLSSECDQMKRASDREWERSIKLAEQLLAGIEDDDEF